jgi:hypothetical protein
MRTHCFDSAPVGPALVAKPVVFGTVLSATVVRGLACLGTLALLSACASHRPQVSATQEAAQYAAHARRDYRPPGPSSDPWGPYIVEAAAKYDVPERWVREVMRQESGGELYENGQLITSSAGAMGLMQVMPQTYDELRARYSLGDDPYDPHDNVMAGTAYMRELYDIYGSPGFLAAYNAGPQRLDDYLTRNRGLPDETRHYVARIGPRIADAAPIRPSAVNNYAMNQLPIYIPPGPRYPVRHTTAPVALAENRYTRSGDSRPSVQTEPLPQPPRPVAPQVVVAASAAPKGHGGFHLIAPAMADTLPAHRGGPNTGSWAIQVGAFGNQGLARAAADSARERAPDVLAVAHPVIGTVHQASATLYRARLTGLSRDAAMRACSKIAHGRASCIVLSPEAQS